MELAELIEAIKAVDKTEFKEALQKEVQSHYQEIFNTGHKTATVANKAKIEEAEKKIAELETALTSKGEELTELSKKSPDIEKLKGEYEDKLVKAQEALKAKESEWKSKFDSKEKERLKATLINELQGLHVDPWAAAKAVDDSVMSRIHVTDDGYKVYQADGATPYAAADDQSPLTLLASDLIGTIPETLVRPPKNNGSGYKGGNEGKSSSTKKRSEFSKSERIAYISEHGREAYEALPMQ